MEKVHLGILKEHIPEAKCIDGFMKEERNMF